MTKRNTVLPVPAFMPAVLALVGPEEKNSNAPPHVQRMSSRPMSRRHANAKAIPQNTPGRVSDDVRKAHNLSVLG